MSRAHLIEQTSEIGEVLDMTTLVGRNRHCLDVLLHRGASHFGHGPVMAEVDHLGPLRLQYAAHDVDGRVVAVEETRRRDDSDRIGGNVQRHGNPWEVR